MPERTGPDSPKQKLVHGIRHYTRLLASYRPGRLAINTLSGTFWQTVRVIGQMLSVILIARVLGADGYGTLVGFGGLATILSCVAWVGSSYLLLQAVSRNPTLFGRYWYATLRTIMLGGLVLSAIYVITAPALLRMPLGVLPLLAIALSELICAPLVYACGFAFQAHEKLGWANGLPTLLTLSRLLGVGAFTLISYDTSFAHYILFHMGSSLLAATGAWLVVRYKLRPHYKGKAQHSWSELREGLHFSATALTTGAYSEMDKILAVRYLSTGPAGVYAIAYRLTTALAMPIGSLLLAAQPRIFRHAHDPRSPELRRLLTAITLTTLAYATVTAAAVVLIAPFLTSLLGNSFAPAVAASRFLVPLLPFFCLRLLAVTILTGLGQPARRAVIELIATGLLLGGASILTPLYGLTGLISSVLIAEALLVTTLLWTVIHTLKSKS